MDRKKKVESVINEITARINNRTTYIQSCIELFNKTYDDALTLAFETKNMYIRISNDDDTSAKNEEQRREIVIQRLRDKKYEIRVSAPYHDGEQSEMLARIYVHEEGPDKKWTEINTTLYDLDDMLPSKIFAADFVWNPEKETWQETED